MKRLIKISLPIKPLSINSCWQGRRYKTKEAKIYDKSLQLLLPQKKIEAQFYSVKYIFYLKSILRADLDNFIKVIQDNLVEKGIIKDDRYILQIEAQKIKSEKDYIEIEIIEFKN